MTFYEFMMKNHKGKDTPEGDLAEDMFQDGQHFPNINGQNLNMCHRIMIDYLKNHNACDGCLDAFEKSWGEYVQQEKSRQKIDIDQVKYDIERCISHVPDACRDCSHYWDKKDGDFTAIGCMEKLLAEAYDLLKKQEAVEPEVEVLNEIDRLYKCPRCHKYFFHRKQKYCDQCGQAVKWDG